MFFATKETIYLEYALPVQIRRLSNLHLGRIIGEHRVHLESEGTEACALTEAGKLKPSKPKQSGASQVYILNNENGGGGAGEPPHPREKHFKVTGSTEGKNERGTGAEHRMFSLF